MKRLTVKALTDNLYTVLEFIDAELEMAGISKKIQFQIDIAVEEIYVNIANYAYAPKTGNMAIEFDINTSPPAVEIKFIDGGKPYNPLCNAEPDITLSAEKRQIGGLGIFMTKKSMDSVQYRFEDNKNILTIKKYF